MGEDGGFIDGGVRKEREGLGLLLPPLSWVFFLLEGAHSPTSLLGAWVPPFSSLVLVWPLSLYVL